MSVAGSPTHGASLRLCFRPGTLQIASATRLIADVCGELIEDAATSRIVLTVHELMENTAKYSDDDLPSIAVDLLIAGEQQRVRIETRNRSNPCQIARLSTLLDRILGATNPRALYRDLIAAAPERKEGSGLGLARIRVEAEMELGYSIEGDFVVVVAETIVRPRNAE